jgi:hypothetical protein
MFSRDTITGPQASMKEVILFTEREFTLCSSFSSDLKQYTTYVSLGAFAASELEHLTRLIAREDYIKYTTYVAFVWIGTWLIGSPDKIT